MSLIYQYQIQSRNLLWIIISRIKTRLVCLVHVYYHFSHNFLITFFNNNNVRREGYYFVVLSSCVHDNSKNNGSIDVKLEHTVVDENSLDEFDIGHCPIKVEVMAWLWNFFPFTTIQNVKAHISALAQVRKLWLSMSVNHILIYKIY